MATARKKKASLPQSGKKRVGAVIQARMGSRRLPGKVLTPIAGHAMLWHVVKRVQRAKKVEHVIVATSTEKSDDAIVEFCRQEGVACVRGSEDDVLSRYYKAAEEHALDVIVRITADCPLVDPKIIDRVVSDFLRQDLDVYGTDTTFPDGVDTEVFSRRALSTAFNEARKSSEREHVTPYLWYSGQFRSGRLSNPEHRPNEKHRWSVDSPEDVTFISGVLKKLGKKTDFGVREVVACLRKNPELMNVNASLINNQGYAHSLYQEAKAGAAPARSLRKANQWLKRSENLIPGCSQTFSKGRSQHVQGVSPIFLERGKGCRVWDVDGNEYIDYIQGLLPNILGYAHEEVNAAVVKQLSEGLSFSLPHPREIELAEVLARLIPCAEMAKFAKNGSDATTGAVRCARAYTGREHILTCGYHGWHDWYIGSTTRNAGVPRAVGELTHPFVYNDLASLEKLFEQYAGKVAAVILEPVNFVEPQFGFLQGVRKLATAHGAVLIFDEICSGFHFGLGGAQKRYGVTPDLACFGKAMGNGFPIACIVGRRDLMKLFEEAFVSFTFGGEVASMAASLKVIEILETTDALARLESSGRRLKDGFNALAKEAGLFPRFECIGSPNWSALKFRDAEGKDGLLERSLYQQETSKRGVLQLTSHNMTAVHDDVAVERTLEVYAAVLKTLAKWLSDKKPARYLEGKMIQPVFKVR